jgi:hypothetical protein
MTATENSVTSSATQDSEKKMFFNIDWKPDIRLLDKQQLSAYCELARPAMARPIAFCEDLEFLCLSFITKALNAAQELEYSKLKPHIQRYIDWMQRKRDQFRSGELPMSRCEWKDYLEDQDYQDAVFRRVQNTNIHGRFYGEVIKSLPKIISGRSMSLNFSSRMIF